MSDSLPPYSPSSYTPLPSIWTRVLNWVSPPLSVTLGDLRLGLALEDLQPDIAVAVEDLRPRAKYVQTTLAAVKDIRVCEKIFNEWMTELDKVNSSSEKPDERERLLRFYLGLLKKDAGRCSNETNEILQRHVRFASLMAQRIDDASVSQYNLKYDDSETTRLADDISEAADSLSTDVTKMMDNLNSFVSVLERVQVTVKKEPSPPETMGPSPPENTDPSRLQKFLRWVKNMLQVIARFLAKLAAKVCSLIARLRPSSEGPGLKNQDNFSILEEGAATFCKADPEPQEGKEFEILDSVIIYLKEIVPRGVQTAQDKLKRFDEALDIMGLERHMREGRRVTLFGPDPASIAKKWRDAAEQYQSAFDQK
ncbi:hypothetical protein F5888DRAFT_297640 [Russula emetica]|nr:hypothetical protein F5888DRAFT_297640 [Russula emetica]